MPEENVFFGLKDINVSVRDRVNQREGKLLKYRIPFSIKKTQTLVR